MKKVYVIGIIILLIGVNVSGSFVKETKDVFTIGFKGTTLYVGGSGPGNYTSIQDAIDNASDGDIVFVYARPNPYYEHLLINKSFSLIGQNQSATIIDGNNTNIPIYIKSNQVVINNLSICNSGGKKRDAGIMTIAENTSIINCTVYRSRTGIYIQNTTTPTIKYCSIHTSGEGILCNHSACLNISYSQFCHNAIGLHLNASANSKVTSSFFHTNGFGCYLEHSKTTRFDHCAFDDNNDNQGGIYLTDTTDIVLNNSNLNHNGVGIIIDDSKNIQITRCDINLNTKRAARIKGSSSNITFIGNEISINYHYGIHTTVPLILQNNNFYDNELHALYATQKCDADNNWWNSPLGPTITIFGLGERISRFTIKRFPWLLKPADDAGSSWETATCFTPLQIPISHHELDIFGNDSDYDGAPDWWESKYGYDPYCWDNHISLDEDNDGLTNIEECYTDAWGSHPFKKDIFLEIDWMETQYTGTTNKPDSNLLEQATIMFYKHNITLHVDDSSMGGGEQIPYQPSPSFAEFRDLYWNYFLHEDLNNPRKGIFHYGLIADDGEAGYALFGWDQLDFFNIGAQQLQIAFPQYDKPHLIIYGMLHELGHGLGLFGDTHGGIDNRESIKFSSLQTWYYLNYRSCMNYHYTFSILGYSNGGHGFGDFNDWKHLNLSVFKNTIFK